MNKVDMSTPLVSGMIKSFFGLNGALPLSFTDNILRESQYQNVFQFFDEIFTKIITSKELEYCAKPYNYIKYFHKIKHNRPNVLRKFPIHQNYNQLCVSKLSFFILGQYGILPFYSKENNNNILLSTYIIK